MDLYAKFVLLVLLIVVFTSLIFLVVRLHRFKRKNPILYAQQSELSVLFKSPHNVDQNIEETQNMLEHAKQTNNLSEIKYAEEALKQVKKLDYIYQNNTGLKITKIPPAPQNLTYSIAFKCQIKNHPNSLEPFCIFYRGEDIESASPSVFVHPKDMSLVINFQDNEYKSMKVRTKSLPLQRSNLIYLVIQNRKIYIILNKKMFQFKLLECVPVLASGPLRLLPGVASEHVSISYMRYYDHVLKPTVQKEEFVEGFESSEFSNENNRENDTGKSIVHIRPNDIYDTFYAKVFTELVAKNNEHVSRYIAKIIAGYTEMSDYNKPSVLDIGGGGSFFLKHLHDIQTSHLEYNLLDKSGAMLNEVKKHSKHVPINFHKGNATNPNLFEPQSFSHITCLGLSVYSMHFELLAENVSRWLRHGGWFSLHVVNPDKFDPVHTVASPFVGIKAQDYSQRRLTESQIHFDGFKYFSNFIFKKENVVHMEEEFHFHDSKMVRKQTHVMIMPPIDVLVSYFTKYDLHLKKTFSLDLVDRSYEFILNFQKS